MRKDRHARHLTAAKRRIEAMQLRQQGFSFKEIGEKLGCSQQRAHAIVHEEFARLRAEQNELAENILRVTNDRIEALLKMQWQRAMQGDRLATETVLKLVDRQARLFGVDAPRKTEARVDLNDTTDPAALKARARMMGLDMSDLEEKEAPPVTTEHQSSIIGGGDGHT